MKTTKQIQMLIDDLKHIKWKVKKLEKENKVMSYNLKKLGKSLIKKQLNHNQGR